MVIKINYTSSDVYVSTSVSPVYVVVNYSGTTGGGGGVWGAITGTLSNQTDLQTALDNKVPYTGATGDVNLGEFSLSAGQVTLDTTPTGTASVATTRWNDAIGISETTLKGGNVVLKNGVDLVARVVNKVSPNTTLTKANYQAVKISGAQGQRLAVALAQANNDANSADTIGLVTETIATNQEGFIMTMGNLEGINTTGSLQGETWADGDVLYLSPTTAGRLTNIKPTGATGHIVVIGYVEYSHINNGKIYVKIMNGWELSELHDTFISSPTNNDALIYESSTQLWKNKTIATALGYTPVPTTRTLTINGTAYDLSADRSWTVSASATPAGSNTQIQYNNSGVFGASAGFTYNDSTGSMTLTKNQSSDTSFAIINQSSRAYLSCQVDNGVFLHAKTPIGYTAYKILSGGDGYLYNSSTGDITLLNDNASGKIKFGAGGTSTAQMTLTTAGRLLLGTTTESTYIFDAVGSARITGDLGIGGVPTGTYGKLSVYGGISMKNDNSAKFELSRFSVAYPNSYIKLGTSSDSLRINNANETSEILTLFNDGNLLLSTTLGTAVNAGYKLDVNGTARVGATFTISASNGIPAATTDVLNIASGFTTPDIGRIYVGDGTGWRLHFSKRIASVTTDLVSITDSGDLSVSGVFRETVTTNRQTASYTLALTDRGKLVEMNVATANNLTVPLNSSIAFPIGSKIDIAQYGAGQTTIVATSGVTVRSAGGALKLAAQYSGASLVKIGTDEWYLFGDITV